jgi:DNA-binding NtrC family response regulator
MSDWPVLLICADEATQSRVAGLLCELGYEAILPRSRAEAIAALAMADPHLAGTSRASEDAVEPASAPAAAPSGGVLLKDIARKAAQEAERHAILRMLERTQWNRVRAAKLLRISYRTLLYKMKGAGLVRAALGARSTT